MDSNAGIEENNVSDNNLTNWIERAALAALALLNPWRTVRQLREENARLVAAITDPLVTGIHMGNGSLNIEMEGLGPQLVAGLFLGMFEQYPDAKNYIEITFSSRMGPILVTVIKPGGKTPDQLRREAERKLAEHLNTHNDKGNAPQKAAYGETQ